jgi:hypothetical protein
MRKTVGLVVVLALIMTSGFITHAGEPTFNLEVTPDCGFNMLEWEAVPGATQYFIYRGNAPGEEFNTPLLDFPIQETHFKDEINIKNGQEYCYFITALNSKAEEFATSTEACAIPSCYQEPDEDECKLVLRYQQDNTMYFANGEQKGPMETPPVNKHSRLFLVIRYVTEEIPGTTIDWVSATKQVIITTRDGKRIELQIGNNNAVVDGQTTQIDPNNPDVVPYISEGRTLCPMRFVAENLGATGPNDIKWYGDTKTVELRFDDPMCERKGILDATTERLDDGRYRISATYYSPDGHIPGVSLLLTKKHGSKSFTIGGTREKQFPEGDFQPVKTSKPTITKMKTENGEAQKFSWVARLDPGVMYFYAFEAKKTNERLPEKGYLGPLLTPLEGISRITELNIEEMTTDEETLLQGFYSSEPYPMLFEDYWSIFERQAPAKGTTVHVRLPEGVNIETGEYISCKVQKKLDKSTLPILSISEISTIFQITKPNLAEKMEIKPVFDLADIICGCRYGIMFTGGTNAQKVEDNEGVEHSYQRLRADFVADSIRGYDTMLMMGVCKSNMHVLYGGGDSSIDLISAEDGDGNPFDFNWNDGNYRDQMEQQAQDRWRAGDGWSIKSATKANFEDAIDEIVADIEDNGNCDPEVVIMVSDHGSRGGGDATEDDGIPGYICSYSGNWLDDNWFTDQIGRIDSACGWQREPKIWIMMGTCHAGEFVDDFNDKLKTAGLEAICLATCSNDVGGGIGQWQNGANNTYNESTGGTYGSPFNHSIREQLENASPSGWGSFDDLSWRVAHDYAVANDWAAQGWWKEHDDGSKTWHQTFPQYWRSSDMMMIMPGFGQVIDEPDPGMIQMNPCRFGVDASESTFDICNCHYVDFDNGFKRKLVLQSNSNYPMEVIVSSDDEGILETCRDEDSSPWRDDVSFCRSDSQGANTYNELTVELDPRESVEIYAYIVPYWMKKQPLDNNGYMATDGGLPEFVEVPIHFEYTCTLDDDDTFTSSVDVPLNVRVHGMAFDVHYSTNTFRKPTRNDDNAISSNSRPEVVILPELSGATPDVIAVPASHGDVRLSLSTPAYELTPDGNTRYNFLDSFEIILEAVDSDGGSCVNPNTERRIPWGEVSVRTLDSKGIAPFSRWEVVESRFPKTNDKLIKLLFTGDASNIEDMIGNHEIQVSYQFNDNSCCGNFREGEPGEPRIVDIYIRLTITDPERKNVDSEFFQAI